MHYPPAFVDQYASIALAVQRDFAAVGVVTDLRDYPTGEFFAQARSKELPGLFLFPFGAAYEPEAYASVFDGDGAYGFASPYEFGGMPELREARERTPTTLDPEERAAAIEDLYVAHYQRAGFIYLTELSAYHATAANIEWPLGAAQFAGQISFHQINVLKT